VLCAFLFLAPFHPAKEQLHLLMHLMTIVDDIGESITFSYPPRRIISLVPSQTELLHYFDLNEEVLGITKFCVHPASWHQTKIQIGGTKVFDFDAIDKLQPDLIIGNKEENYLEGINKLKQKYPVFITDIKSLPDAWRMIISLGRITNREDYANRLVELLQNEFSSLRRFAPARVVYLIWRKPWMAAGRDTFINDMLERIGLYNVVTTDRYPTITEDVLRRLDPEYVLLSSEPYPFKTKHQDEIKSILPNATSLLVDGEMFSWYGSRLLLAGKYFSELPFNR
jgi:ABC-type Fe3+-hydroxamate transport system substrate-binding protein